jgi:hypothetical protein
MSQMHKLQRICHAGLRSGIQASLIFNGFRLTTGVLHFSNTEAREEKLVAETGMTRGVNNVLYCFVKDIIKDIIKPALNILI